MEGDWNCMYHALALGMNEFNLDWCNEKWNQKALREVIFQYYTEVRHDENHENNSVWKRLFAHISDNEVTEYELMRSKITPEQVNKNKFDHFFKNSVPVDDGEMNQYWLCLWWNLRSMYTFSAKEMISKIEKWRSVQSTLMITWV